MGFESNIISFLRHHFVHRTVEALRGGTAPAGPDGAPGGVGRRLTTLQPPSLSPLPSTPDPHPHSHAICRRRICLRCRQGRAHPEVPHHRGGATPRVVFQQSQSEKSCDYSNLIHSHVLVRPTPLQMRWVPNRGSTHFC